MGGLIQWVSDDILRRSGGREGGAGEERERERPRYGGEKEKNGRKVGEDKKWGES